MRHCLRKDLSIQTEFVDKKYLARRFFGHVNGDIACLLSTLYTYTSIMISLLSLPLSHSISFTYRGVTIHPTAAHTYATANLRSTVSPLRSQLRRNSGRCIHLEAQRPNHSRQTKRTNRKYTTPPPPSASPDTTI